MSIDLAAAPFCLDEAGRGWVRSTLESMSTIDKVGQLFCEIVWEQEADAPERLLDIIMDAGLNPPFSCRQGICGACATRLVEGEVELVNNEVLEEEDFADGYTLACQALPVTDTVRVTYE